MQKSDHKQKGISILGILFLGVLIILVLSYFHISIKAILESPTGQENVNYVGGGVKSLWTNYLEKPVLFFWNNILIKDFWQPVTSGVGKINFSQPSVNLNLQP